MEPLSAVKVSRNIFSHNKKSGCRVSNSHFVMQRGQCSRIRILRFFSDFKKHDFTFFEMMYQKVVKSR